MISSLTGFTLKKQVAILKFKMAVVKVHSWPGTDPKIVFIINLAMYQHSCFYHKSHADMECQKQSFCAEKGQHVTRILALTELAKMHCDRLMFTSGLKSIILYIVCICSVESAHMQIII